MDETLFADSVIMDAVANEIANVDPKTKPKDEPLEKEDATVKQVLQMPPMEFFNKSFEAMWYQAEVLHKREMEKWGELLKEQATAYETKLAEVETNLKAGIYQMSKDILFTILENTNAADEEEDTDIIDTVEV